MKRLSTVRGRPARRLVILTGMSVAMACALTAAPARAIDADFVIEQHNHVVEALADTPVTVMAHAQTMADLAAFNALNAITPRYHAYRAPIEARPEAQAEAALLAAHWTVLSTVDGIDVTKLARRYEDAMAKLPPSPAKRAGRALGRQTALAIQLERASDDFFERAEPVPGAAAPGVYRLTPGFPQQAGTEFTQARPFSVASIAAFDPGPPPVPGSAPALKDLRESSEIGRLDSRTRTAEQTAAAIFWNSFDDLDQVAILRELARERRHDALDTARALALRSVAAFDARIAIMTYKHRYDYWRPYTALRDASAPATLRDPQWLPLLRTHPHQDYPSSAGALMGAFVVGLKQVGANGRLSMYDSPTGQVREWASADAMAQELLDARVWAGVHFRTATIAGYAMGRAIARSVYERELLPLGHGADAAAVAPASGTYERAAASLADAVP